MTTYALSKLKTFNGMEGRGFNVTLMRDGKPVADVIDSAHGGPFMFHWLDRDTRATVKTVDYVDQHREYLGTVEEAMFAAYCLTLPKWEGLGGEVYFQPFDMVIDNLVNALQSEKRFRRLIKTKLVFINEGKPYTYALKPGTTQEQTVTELRKTYPQAVISNLLPIEEALRLARAAGI